MTKVIYDEARYTLEFRGHAGDKFICAGLSTLVGTAQGMRELYPQVLNAEIETDETQGHALIRCKPTQGYENECRYILRTIFTGAAVLAENYPGNVEAIKGGVDNVSDR